MNGTMHGKRLLDALADAGIIDPDDKVRRVIIDVRADDVPILYVERIGDTRLLNIVRALDGIEIRRDEPSIARGTPGTVRFGEVTG